MKKAKSRLPQIIAAVIVTVALTVVPFVSVFLAGVLTPPQYTQTYYGELSAMYARLKNTTGKKVIIIGNSNVAFGVDSALAEELLKEGGLDYSVCNFGLYGALGTKMMLDLSSGCVSEGDIVIFSPEIIEQSLSLYFSAEEAWYALDGDMSMFSAFDSQTRGQLAGGFFGYVAKKFGLYTDGAPASPSGVYASSSFDEHCDLKNYDRSHNVMDGGVDLNNPVYFDTAYFTQDFVDYVNAYYSEIKSVGAEMYYSFAPVCRQSVDGQSLESLDEFYLFVEECFDFTVISSIEDSLMDSGWFYDSNHHLNEAGMTVRTVNLVNDIKNQLGNTTKTEVVLPEMPVIPQPGTEGEGDNSCADCFTYEREGNYYVITGLTEKGGSAERLVVPYQVDGLYVKSFLPSVFAGNRNIRSVTVQQNIRTVYDGSFDGCTNMQELFFEHESPSDISVGYNLLKGTSCRIYVHRQALSAFKNDYFWGSYADKLYAY
ncbi:MAG: hypothetical protein ACI4MH_00995 [Candidatus Coproplasma sp.]